MIGEISCAINRVEEQIEELKKTLVSLNEEKQEILDME